MIIPQAVVISVMVVIDSRQAYITAKAQRRKGRKDINSLILV